MATSIQSFRNQLNAQTGATILTTLATVVAVGLFAWFILWPTWQDYKSVSVKSAELQARSEQLVQDGKAVQDLAAMLKSEPETGATLDAAIPVETRMTTMPVLLEQAAKSASMQLTSVGVDGIDNLSFNPQNSGSNFKPARRQLQTVGVNVGVTGSVEQLQVFLQNLEASQRLVGVDQIDVQAGDPSPKFKLKLKFYQYNTPVKDAAVAGSPAVVETTEKAK